MNTLAEKTIACESKRRLFVGCLASYNSGIIHGEWLDFSDYYDIDELKEKVNAILKSSPCQGDEYDVQDYEGFGDLLKKHMYPSLNEAWAIHETLELAEKEDIDVEIFLEFVSANGDIDFLKDDSNCLVRKYQDSFLGCYSSLADYAEETCDISEVPSYLRNYIDFERMARDMELGGDIFAIGGYREIYVFSNHY